MKRLLLIVFVMLWGNMLSAQQKFDAHQLLTDIKKLSSGDFEGRKSGTKGIVKAQKYIMMRFLDYDLLSFNGTYKQKFKFELKGQSVEGTNLVGYIKGKKDPNKFVAICAHYDHLGIKNGQIYNGADDNASGVAGMFSVAEYYKTHTPDYSVLFIAFDAEEWGLKGAKYFVENPPFSLDSLVALVNIDMISRNDKNELYACGTYHYSYLKGMIKEAVKGNHEVKIKFGHDQPRSNNTGLDDWTFASDHGPFHLAKVPFIYFGVEDHADYHKPSDTFDTINQVFFVNSVNLVIDVMVYFDKNMDKLLKNRYKNN